MGVDSTRLSDRLRTYDGQAWWLPLNRRLRQGKPFDVPQAFQAAWDALDGLSWAPRAPPHAREDLGAFFCSDLVAAGLEAWGMVGRINASEVTPVDLCRWNIFESDYYQVYWSKPPRKDEWVEISRYNRLDPAQWAA